MAVRDEHVSALRAFLSQDFGEYDRLSDQFDRTDGWDGYQVVLQAAFFEAVDRRFGKGHTVAQIVQWVADARSHYEESGRTVDPSVAERLMLIALGDDASVDEVDGKSVGAAQLFVVAALITEDNLDDAGVDAFMNEVRKTADEWPSD